VRFFLKKVFRVLIFCLEIRNSFFRKTISKTELKNPQGFKTLQYRNSAIQIQILLSPKTVQYNHKFLAHENSFGVYQIIKQEKESKFFSPLKEISY